MSLLLLVVGPLLAGCSVTIPRPPAPPALPDLEGVRVDFPDRADTEFEAPRIWAEENLEGDGLLDSPWIVHPEVERRTEFWVDLWVGRSAGDMRRYLQRMSLYGALVDERIREAGLPPSLRYLPIVESGFNPVAVSRVGATGMWQFMTPTARWLGMEVTPLLDERRDPIRSTTFALHYLESLYRQFDSWLLALSAYNAGPGRIARLIDQHAAGLESGDGVYWAIYPHLPPETRDFLPRFLAAARIAGDPAEHGFGELEVPDAWAFDDVSVPAATSIDVIAKAAGVPEQEILALNPQLLRGMTPAGVATSLRVPAGQGERFATEYARVPPESRISFREHRVVRGETMSHIAVRYGVSLRELEAANPRVTPSRIQVGQRLIVPMGGRGTGGVTASAAPSRAPAVSRSYRVEPGDTLSGIAARHGLRAADLASANGLSLNGVIRPGDRLTIPAR